jgi:hypothetical protein
MNARIPSFCASFSASSSPSRKRSKIDGVDSIVLAIASIWADELGGHKAHGMTQGLEARYPLMCAATSFHPYQTGR